MDFNLAARTAVVTRGQHRHRTGRRPPAGRQRRPVATDLWLGSDGVAATVSQAIGTAPDEVESQAAAQSASGRSSQPDEIADLILYLASDRAANTGSELRHRRRPAPHRVADPVPASTAAGPRCDPFGLRSGGRVVARARSRRDGYDLLACTGLPLYAGTIRRLG
jgi:hypothetical protein